MTYFLVKKSLKHLKITILNSQNVNLKKIKLISKLYSSLKKLLIQLNLRYQ